MRYISIILLIALFNSLIFCQNTCKKSGAYRNIIDYKRNAPFIVSNFDFQLTDTAHNIYWPSIDKKVVKKKDLKQTIWCIYDNNTLYLNCFRLGMNKGYAKVLVPGRYSYFIARPILSNSDELLIENNGYMYGAVGSAITTYSIMKQKKDEIHYILDLEKGMPVLFTKNNLIRILQDYPVLLYDYEKEDDGESVDVMVKYIELVNEKIEVQDTGM